MITGYLRLFRYATILSQDFYDGGLYKTEERKSEENKNGVSFIQHVISTCLLTFQMPKIRQRKNLRQIYGDERRIPGYHCTSI